MPRPAAPPTPAGLGAVTGRIAPGLAADFLLVDLDRPEFTPSHDLTWELVRYGNRDQIDAVFTNGRLRHGAGLAGGLGCPRADGARSASAPPRPSRSAPIQRVHPTADSIVAARAA